MTWQMTRQSSFERSRQINHRSARAFAVLLALTAALHVASAGLSASSFWMTEPALRASFAGSLINGQYVDGRFFAERYDVSGRLSYVESANNRNWTGHWSVVRDRFCTIYDTAVTGGCFRVRQVSANCFEFFFDTRTEEEARRSTPRQPTWTARGWRADSVSTCAERPMV